MNVFSKSKPFISLQKAPSPNSKEEEGQSKKSEAPVGESPAERESEDATSKNTHTQEQVGDPGKYMLDIRYISVFGLDKFLKLERSLYFTIIKSIRSLCGPTTKHNMNTFKNRGRLPPPTPSYTVSQYRLVCHKVQYKDCDSSRNLEQQVCCMGKTKIKSKPLSSRS